MRDAARPSTRTGWRSSSAVASLDLRRARRRGRRGGRRAPRARASAPGDAVLRARGQRRRARSSPIHARAAARRAGDGRARPAPGAAQVRDIVADDRAARSCSRPTSLLPDRDDGGRPRWLPPRAIGDADPGRGRTPGSPRDPDEPSMVIFTSGTTSRPEGRRPLAQHDAGRRRATTSTPRASPPADNLFVISPLASVTGMMQAITVAPALGAQLTIESRFDDAATFDFLVETGGTFFGGPDLLLDRVLDEAERRGRHRRADHDRVPRRVHARPAHPRPRRARVRHRRAARRTARRRHRSAPRARAASRKPSAWPTTAARSRGVEVRIGSQARPGRVLHRRRAPVPRLRRSRRRRRRVRRRLVPHRRPRRAARRSAADRRAASRTS